jgi:hypothetical protein
MLFRGAAVVMLLAASLVACSGGGGSPSPGTRVTLQTPTPSPNPTQSPTPAPSGSGVTIAVSESSNTQAYTIVLQTNASATYTLGGANPQSTTVPTADAAQFFSDLNANVPLSNVQTGAACVKSASFGTTTILTYEGSSSGDVSCPPSTTSPAQTLWNDARTIETDIGATH